MTEHSRFRQSEAKAISAFRFFGAGYAIVISDERQQVTKMQPASTLPADKYLSSNRSSLRIANLGLRPPGKTPAEII
ncbi:hypothetical protein K9U39_06515 [Rhodoblastus acidophilus]|nr:hypothetical protein [Rhodoblastus acidophilus]